MLQSGVRYETVVKPRVTKISRYTEAEASTGFLKLLERVGERKLLDWSDTEKPRRVLKVTRFFVEEHIETEEDLKNWLKNEANIVKLKKLRGIGDKTADYFKNLVGISTSAVDRHLIKFLNQANINVKIDEYVKAREIINRAAETLKIDKSIFDHSIWKYMSCKKYRT